MHARMLRDQDPNDDRLTRILGHSDPNFTRRTYGTRDRGEVVRFDDAPLGLFIDAEDGDEERSANGG